MDEPSGSSAQSCGAREPSPVAVCAAAPSHWSPRQQALIAAIKHWWVNRVVPKEREQLIVAALATCSPRLLSAARVRNAAQAWPTLDDEAIAVIRASQDWAPAPARAPEPVPEADPQPEPEPDRSLIRRALDFRKAQRESQSVFWGRFGAGQSTSCRYETFRPLPRPMRILVSLFLAGELSDAELERFRAWADGDTSRLGAVQRARLALALEAPEQWRHDLGKQQEVFWGMFGTTQTGGSRYESGRAIPKQVRMLLAARALDRVTDEQLARFSRAPRRRRQK